MELTQKTFIARLEYLKDLHTKTEENHQLAARLHEKGVECSVVVPLLEVILEFDALRDVCYEQESTTKHGQRFDFLLDGCFLIEVKALGANLEEHYRQVTRYIQGNDDINFGILTNGIDYQIWLQKTFMEKVSGAELKHTPPVAKILSLSLAEDSVQFVLEAFSIFKKEHYQSTFKTIASIAGYYAAGGRGRPANVHEDRKMNEALRDRIRESVSVTKGVYYDQVSKGDLQVGDKLCFRDECVEIMVEVTATGTVILRKGAANIVDMVKAMDEGWAAMIPLVTQKWAKSDSEFQDPLEIVKLAQNKQRLFNKERYVFNRQ